jgi:putative restriction endonuclease
MNLYVYPTDPNWYRYLSQQSDIDEVNFWRPGGSQAFRQLQPGDLLLFRLRSPINKIAGGGIYTHFSFAPLAQVWEAFGRKNGTADYDSFRSLIAKHRELPPNAADTAVIGCIILSSPFFFPPDLWIPVPEDYPVASQQGRKYDASAASGRKLFDAIADAMKALKPKFIAEPGLLVEPGSAAVEFRDALARRRLGQGAFSLMVADAYGKRCTVTGERTYPVLEAAHIKAVKDGGIHRIDNGLLLRSDIHKLFDRGYVTITPDLNFRVSDALRSEWHNGKIYYALDKQPIRSPDSVEYRPSAEFLEWHRDTIFKG